MGNINEGLLKDLEEATADKINDIIKTDEEPPYKTDFAYNQYIWNRTYARIYEELTNNMETEEEQISLIYELYDDLLITQKNHQKNKTT